MKSLGWKRALGLLCSLSLTLAVRAGEKPESTIPRDDRTTVVYQVADLMSVFPDRPAAAQDRLTLERRGRALEEALKSRIGRDRWTDRDSMVFRPETQSLVVRQTSKIQNRLAAECAALRAERDVYVVLRCRVLTGPRSQVFDLAASVEGGLGALETERLERTAGLRKTDLAKTSVFGGQSVAIPYEGRQVILSATVTPDRRWVTIKISEGEVAGAGAEAGAENVRALVAATQTGKIRDQASAAFYFEASRAAPAIPPTNESLERIVLVTPELVVHEEEEELLSAER